MSKEIKADYTKTYLFPPSVEDWVDADHPARFIRAVVGELDLHQYGFKVGRREHGMDNGAGQGRPYYSDELLLKAWLYGYMSGIWSSRKLEKACRENVGLIWLLGTEEPDHNTLWRFWQRNRQSLRQVFRGVVRIGLQTKLLGMVLHAVDGTKIQARCSSRSKQVLRGRELTKQLQQIEQVIEEIEAEIAAHGEEPGEGYRLPEKLRDNNKLREEIREALRVLKEEDTATVHPKEREARMMKLGAEKRLGYNAQAVVDEKTGMVVAEKVVNAAADQGELDGMLDETEKNLGKTAEDTVADKGYRSDEAIGKAYEKKQSVLVHLYENEQPGKADRYHKCNFQYDEQIDVFICPEGKRLTFEREATQWRQGWKQRVYRCRQLHNCPKASECSQDARGRTVALGRYWKAVQEQRERQSQEGNRGKMWKRRTIVELVFAQIKHNSGFRRYTFPGLSGVQAQWSFLCTAHNLKKLYALWKQGNLALDPAT